MRRIRSSRSGASPRLVCPRRCESTPISSVVRKILLCAIAVAWGFGVSAKTQNPDLVREALDYQNGKTVSGYLRRDMRVLGILTNEPFPVGATAAIADLQDATGGIALHFPLPVATAGQFERGDEVRARGTIEEYEGQTDIRVHDLKLVHPGQFPAPRDVLAIDLHRIRDWGQLLRIPGQSSLRKGASRADELVLRDRSGKVPIYMGSAAMREPRLVHQVTQGGPATIVGVPNYFQPEGRAALGVFCRLIPRGPADFVIHPTRSYRAIAIGIALLLSALLQIYLVLLRRSALRRVQEMAILVVNLQRSEKVLRQSEARYRLLFGRSLAGIYRSTLDGRILHCNESFAHIFGYASPEEVLKSAGGAQEFYSNPSERESFLADLRKHGMLTNLEVALRRKDGTTIWVLENASLVDDESDSRSLIEGTLVDVTKRKQLEQQFRQAQKMQAVGQLTGGLAHDFNNLLTVIKGNAELLLSRAGQDDFICKHTGQIGRAANQAAAMVRQLLAFSRMQVLQPKVLDLNNVVAESTKMLPRLLREDIEVVFVPGEALGLVTADQNQLEQVILNLAVNAGDAMPEGGRLTIETSNADLHEEYPQLHPGGLKPGKYVMLSVRDTGMGMSAETQAHIFEPFFTTKSSGKGTGLGLAMVYGIVKQSGGWIWVYSEIGHGTSFKIYLPRVEKAVDVRLPEDSSRPPATGHETILLAEDQDGIRDLIRPFLQNLGYEILEAPHGEAALELAREHQGTIHLLLTDVVMPKMGGYQLAKLITEMRPEVRVIYMSGYAEYSAPGDRNAHRSELHLQKPFAMQTLAHRVREALDTERQFANQLLQQATK